MDVRVRNVWYRITICDVKLQLERCIPTLMLLKIQYTFRGGNWGKSSTSQQGYLSRNLTSPAVNELASRASSGEGLLALHLATAQPFKPQKSVAGVALCHYKVWNCATKRTFYSRMWHGVFSMGYQSRPAKYIHMLL